jgi:hypothetical protein
MPSGLVTVTAPEIAPFSQVELYEEIKGIG